MKFFPKTDNKMFNVFIENVSIALCWNGKRIRIEFFRDILVTVNHFYNF